MDKQPVAEQIIDFLSKHPGSTNIDISKALNVDANAIAARTSSMSHTGRIRKTPTIGRGMRGVKFTYEVGDPKASNTISKAERDRMRMEKAAKKKNGFHHPNLITTKEQAQAVLAEQQELEEFVESTENSPPEEHSVNDLTILRRAELLVRSGAPISDEEWATIAEIAGESRFDLETRWTPKPEVQERFEVKTPLPEEAEVQMTFEHPFMRLMRQTAESAASAFMDQFQVAVMKQMSGLPGQLVTLPAPIKAVVPNPPMPTAEELAQRIKPEPKVEKKKLQRVLIIGAKPVNAGEIQSAFHDSFEFRFWFDENYDELKEAARWADHCIVWLKGTSHTSADKIRAVGKKPIMVSGGVSMVKEKLMDIYTAPVQ